MQLRAIALRRQVIDAALAIQARGEYPSVRRISRELGYDEGARPGAIHGIRRRLIESGALKIALRRGGERPRFRRP